MENFHVQSVCDTAHEINMEITWNTSMYNPCAACAMWHPELTRKINGKFHVYSMYGIVRSDRGRTGGFHTEITWKFPCAIHVQHRQPNIHGINTEITWNTSMYNPCTTCAMWHPELTRKINGKFHVYSMYGIVRSDCGRTARWIPHGNHMENSMYNPCATHTTQATEHTRNTHGKRMEHFHVKSKCTHTRNTSM